MAAFAAAPWITTAIAAAGTASSMMQGRATAKAQNAELAQRQEILARDYAEAEAERQQRLRQTQAAQRAGFAAAGISGDGSGAALMQSLLDESEQDRGQLWRQYQDRLGGIESTARVNLLRQRQSWLTSGLGLARRSSNFSD